MFESIRPEPRYKSSYNYVWACDYPVIFCTKYRKQILTSAIQNRLKELIIAKQIDYNYTLTALEIMPEHVHILMAVEPKYAVTKIVGKIKGYTSYRLRSEFSGLTRIRALWTNSKFVASTGGVTLEALKEYVEGQKYKEYTQKYESQLIFIKSPKE
ncbi:MAG: IS200/IS605 family transposase [Candidatus Poribacteria bacterium]|nr:IS200/IS605 family transposase [Candidatus Poribacteria bacterium]